MSKQKVEWETIKGREFDAEAIAEYKEGRAVWSWRVFKPIIDEGTCIRCSICDDYCPEGVISKGEDSVEIDYLVCKGCGICAEECPVQAIKMERER